MNQGNFSGGGGEGDYYYANNNNNYNNGEYNQYNNNYNSNHYEGAYYQQGTHDQYGNNNWNSGGYGGDAGYDDGGGEGGNEGYYSYSGNEYGGHAEENHIDEEYYEGYDQYAGQYDYDLNNNHDGMENMLDADPSAVTESLCYSTNQPPIIIHPNGEPDSYGNYDTQGDPISALALDREGNEVEMMFVASHTSLNSGGGGHAGRRGGAGVGRQRGTISMDGTLTRGSRMTVLYQDDQHHGSNHEEGILGSKSVYSTFVAHPEAEARILDTLHGELYGGGSILVSTAGTAKSYHSGTASRKPRPSHAYGPPFGTPSSVAGAAGNPTAVVPNPRHHPLHGGSHDPYASMHRPEDRHCMGIASILPFSTPYLGSGGRVCTVSPHGVRIHTRGGMVMSERRGLLTGMVCGILLDSEGGGSNFATFGGISCPTLEDSYSESSSSYSSSIKRPHHVHCVDLHRDLKIVSSHTLRGDQKNRGLCVSDIAVNHERNNLVLGCSDGTIRLLDGGRRQAEVAKAKAQSGGVAQVAVYDNLICATGYTSPGVSSANSPLPYPFPAQHVLIYDIRYLGRGGIPHMFSANRGGPRFANFLASDCFPDLSGNSADDVGARLLVGSGQTFGGFEVITPFQTNDDVAQSGVNFFQPELSAGESMTTVSIDEGELFIGSSCGRVLRYGMTNYQKTSHSPRQQSASGSSTGVGGQIKTIPLSSLISESFGGEPQSFIRKKDPLDMPPFTPLPPEVSINPTILCSSTNRTDPRLFQGWDIFDSYTMTVDPIVSEEKAAFHPRYSRGKVHATSLGAMSRKPMIPPPKRWLSRGLQTKLDESSLVGGTTQRRGSLSDADFMKVFPTSSVEMSDLLKPNQSKKKESIEEGKTFPNPNKLLYSPSSFASCYDATADPRKKIQEQQSIGVDGEEHFIQNEENGIPYRYRMMNRPPFYKVANFDYSRHNETKIWSGWDYCPTFNNSFACPVLTLLYFIPEIRAAALRCQVLNSNMAIQTGKSLESNVSITAELGLLFHLIQSLSVNGMIHPDAEIKPFVPSNIISAFLLLPEAINLALLDGVVGAAEKAKQTESLYRFLMHYLDKEQEQLNNDQTSRKGLIDPLQGISFLSIIEYAKGKPKISSSRALTVDLSYEQKLNNKNEAAVDVRFGDILRFSLCKEIPLRAWCDETSSYESVVQRKIATNLPKILSLTCCCAGKQGDKNGLQFWQQHDKQNWLPEFIEIQIDKNHDVVVKELAVGESGKEEWILSKQNHPLPAFLFDTVKGASAGDNTSAVTKKYRLETVCSFIRGNGQSAEGHHVVHVRVPEELEIETLERQISKLEECIAERESFEGAEETRERMHLTIASKNPLSTLENRKQKVLEQLQKVKERETQKVEDENQWLLFNGFVVTKTSSDDVRSFNARFKEPSLVIFREIEDVGDTSTDTTQNQHHLNIEVPTSVMHTKSISNGHDAKVSVSDLPGKGDLIAIDAEFVCVQAEESLITSTGSKEITSEPRNSLARLSIIDCRNNSVLVDDYIYQREHVSDYLTRFSGIREIDLDQKNSPHHLVTMQEAYLKVRLLMDRGCIFVGHGLSQDFRVINISVPPNQIIDTATIYHQPNQRFISLRYLTNYVLGRDMQQEIHDSIEDARAAYDLYVHALNLKDEGKFDEYLIKLYTHGHKTQFKLGVQDEDNKIDSS